MIPATMSPGAREAARGIPVRAVCRALSDRHGVVTVHSVHGSTAFVTIDRYPMLPDADEVYARDLIPDLSHPPTRAAYDRDLALALGAPIEAVDEGVMVGWGSSGGLLVVAGLPDARHHAGQDDPSVVYPWAIEVGVEWRLVRTPENLLLARALAWPADKRVPG